MFFFYFMHDEEADYLFLFLPDIISGTAIYFLIGLVFMLSYHLMVKHITLDVVPCLELINLKNLVTFSGML